MVFKWGGPSPWAGTCNKNGARCHTMAACCPLAGAILKGGNEQKDKQAAGGGPGLGPG